MREADPLDAGDARLSPAGAASAPRRRDAARVLPRRAAAAGSNSASSGACARARRSAVPLPLRARAAGRRRRRVSRLSDLELASRLSFFLWSSIPDDELLPSAARRVEGSGDARAAGAADARRPACRRARHQLRRAVAVSARAEERAARLAGLRRQPAQSFQRETELLFRTILQEDRSVVDLLDADFTFVDERLARHYGIPACAGSRMRRVTLPADSPRRGLLGHGSILTLTSAANRTSPVVRGKWVLENLLGRRRRSRRPASKPISRRIPQQVKVTSLRQRLELHRASPRARRAIG